MDNGYKIPSAREFNKLAKYGKLTSKDVLITFDDVAKSAKILFDILVEHQLYFTAFISPYLVQVDDEYMNWSQLVGYLSTGFLDIGNHSFSHESFLDYSKKKIIDEIKRGENEIKKNLNVESCGFAFPYGQFQRWQLSFISKQTGKMIFLTDSKLKDNLINSRYVFKRIPIGKATKMYIFNSALKGRLRFFSRGML